MSLRIVVGAALAGAVWSVAQAQPAPTDEHQRCLAAADQRTSAIAKCEQTDFRRADKALNDAYQQLAATIAADKLGALDRAQRAWFNFRDSQCAYEASSAAGPTAPQVEARCMRRLTELRTRDVQQMLRRDR
jgi:uncharacterized protein YecT (DUF1311 family)